MPGPATVRPPEPGNAAFRVMVRVASGAKVTVPRPGLVASVAGKVEAHAQSAPPVRTELVPSVPPVLGPRLTVWKVPPERVIEV